MAYLLSPILPCFIDKTSLRLRARGISQSNSIAIVRQSQGSPNLKLKHERNEKNVGPIHLPTSVWYHNKPVKQQSVVRRKKERKETKTENEKEKEEEREREKEKNVVVVDPDKPPVNEM